jgi:hypothetical protein
MFQPPTDNLYKFMAIAGIVICLTGLGFFVKKAEEYHSRHVKFENLRDFTVAQQEDLKMKLKDQQRATKVFEEQAKKGNKDIFTDKFLKFIMDEFNLPALKAAEKHTELVRQHNEAIREINHTLFWLLVYGAISFFTTVGGLWLAFRGFWLWYERVQCYQDTELAIKVRPPKRVPINRRTILGQR